MMVGGDWHIDDLTLENYRCFKDLSIDFHPSMTVLVGVNGTGKTAVLDSLAVMLSTVLLQFDGATQGFGLSDARLVPHDLDSGDGVARMEPAYPVSARVSGTLAGDGAWWRRVRTSVKGRTSWGDRNTEVGRLANDVWRRSDEVGPEAPLLPVIALYGVERVRLAPARKSVPPVGRSRSSAYEAALDGAADLSRLSSFVKALTLAEFVADRRGDDATAAKNQLDAMSLACNAILEDTGWRDPAWSPIVDELTLTHPRQGALPLSSLSSGIKITVGLVVDLVSRMARANPRLGAAKLLEQTPGIVLIDEVDLHLHPTWQQRILPQLSRVFPSVQFIVTTHSPQVLSTVGAESIRIIDGDVIRKVEYSAGLRSDVVLNDILGTRPEPELELNRKLDEYVGLVNSGQGLSARAVGLREMLDEEMGGVAKVPKLADADAAIDFYDLEDI